MQSVKAPRPSGRRNTDVPSLRHPGLFVGREATEMTGNRRAWRNGRWASSILLAVIVCLAMGVTPGQGQSPVRGGTLRIGWIPNAKTLDPHLSSVQFSDRYILYMAFNTLVALDRSFNVMPELARVVAGISRREANHVRAPAGSQVSRWHRLQRRSGQMEHRAHLGSATN